MQGTDPSTVYSYHRDPRGGVHIGARPAGPDDLPPKPGSNDEYWQNAFAQMYVDQEKMLSRPISTFDSGFRSGLPAPRRYHPSLDRPLKQLPNGDIVWANKPKNSVIEGIIESVGNWFSRCLGSD